MDKILDEIAKERQHQIEKGWNHDHDDSHHVEGTLSDAALCHLANDHEIDDVHWPFIDYRKHYEYRRRLLVAAAFIVAELELMDRYNDSL